MPFHQPHNNAHVTKQLRTFLFARFPTSTYPREVVRACVRVSNAFSAEVELLRFDHAGDGCSSTKEGTALCIRCLYREVVDVEGFREQTEPNVGLPRFETAISFPSSVTSNKQSEIKTQSKDSPVSTEAKLLGSVGFGRNAYRENMELKVVCEA